MLLLCLRGNYGCHFDPAYLLLLKCQDDVAFAAILLGKVGTGSQAFPCTSLAFHCMAFLKYITICLNAIVTDVKWQRYCADQLPLGQINVTVYYKRQCVSGGICFEVLSHLSALVFTKKLLFWHQDVCKSSYHFVSRFSRRLSAGTHLSICVQSVQKNGIHLFLFVNKVTLNMNVSLFLSYKTCICHYFEKV